MDTSITRQAKQNGDKLVIFEHGAYICYQQEDIGYGMMDWVYKMTINYQVGNEADDKRAAKEAAKFLGVPEFWERFYR